MVFPPPLPVNSRDSCRNLNRAFSKRLYDYRRLPLRPPAQQITLCNWLHHAHVKSCTAVKESGWNTMKWILLQPNWYYVAQNRKFLLVIGLCSSMYYIHALTKVNGVGYDVGIDSSGFTKICAKKISLIRTSIMKRISSALACNPNVNSIIWRSLPNKNQNVRTETNERYVAHSVRFTLWCADLLRYCCLLTVLTIFISWKVLQTASDSWVFPFR